MFWLAVASERWQLTSMADPRLLIEQRLGASARLALNEAQTRHVGTVLRLDAGDVLRVFNAEDGEWRARVSEKTKRTMTVRVEDFLRPARAAPDLELLFAPVKRHATDLIVEKATELGVAAPPPVITQRTIAETVRIDRLESIAREAAEQTERFDLPEIANRCRWPRYSTAGTRRARSCSAMRRAKRRRSPKPPLRLDRHVGVEYAPSAPKGASRRTSAARCGRSHSLSRSRSARVSCARRPR